VQVESFWVGGIECRVVIHGAGRGTPAWLFPHVPPADLHRAMAPFVDRDGQFRFVYSSLVVRVGGLAVLLDAGFPQDSETRVSRLDDALGAVGLSSDDVDAVVVSHGHLDHIAGLTTDSGGARVPSFEHAIHFVHQREFEYGRLTRRPMTGRPPPTCGRLQQLTGWSW
jgi:glyoxylase-like metal-dependent hydrolase (beta-lactamase superfamily II)